MDERDLDSIITLLRNMTLERRQGWRRYVLGRWVINHEPLRADAQRILDSLQQHGHKFLIENPR